MHRPSVADLQSKTTSYYAVVIGVAKRAREITQKALDEGIMLTEKPVTTAVYELARDEYKIVSAEND
ncbi:MAG: DNA-directed RNA polymerase subunit omega [Oscillospiraceae bacterium]|nr:DNA-directed RNA polymerase subunit omega [Oscillospiraceae bacterium]